MAPIHRLFAMPHLLKLIQLAITIEILRNLPNIPRLVNAPSIAYTDKLTIVTIGSLSIVKRIAKLTMFANSCMILIICYNIDNTIIAVIKKYCCKCKYDMIPITLYLNFSTYCFTI